VAKYAKKRGLFQCVMPGRITDWKSAINDSNGSGRSGALAGKREATSPGETFESTG